MKLNETLWLWLYLLLEWMLIRASVESEPVRSELRPALPPPPHVRLKGAVAWAELEHLSRTNSTLYLAKHGMWLRNWMEMGKA